MNLLHHSNVDTFIVFRSCTPLLPCPSKLTFAILVIIFGGAVGYVVTDSAFTLTA
uniref:Uncharacterized protein n=1 Tax=Nelumbo nucifera TaxID=4432 RepID=A0A822XNK5_NELNU|nr:TPA_asm: hypothetical protein HUJ06_023320 [Nelumbo nucifera]